MKKETINKIKNAKANPIFEGLSDELKDPENFLKVERKIAKTMVSDHKHATIKQFIKCKRCQAKVKKKTEMIRELGFKDYNQYASWKKILQIIINKENFQLYEKE